MDKETINNKMKKKLVKNEAVKILIVLVTTVLSLALHSIIPVSVAITEDVASIVVNTLSFIVTVTIFFLITYYLIATVFLRYEHKLYGKRITRSILFGSLVGGIWWVGMIEGVFAFGTHFLEEFLMGFADFIPIVVLCLLISIFLADRKSTGAEEKIKPKLAFNHIGVFIIIFVIGRSIRYFNNINAYQPENLLPLLLWTIIFAFIISLNYVYFKNTARSSTVFRSALHFTLVLFGIHYAMFVFFVPLIFRGMLLELTFVYIYDLMLVLLASFIAYHWNYKIEKRPLVN